MSLEEKKKQLEELKKSKREQGIELPEISGDPMPGKGDSKSNDDDTHSYYMKMNFPEDPQAFLAGFQKLMNGEIPIGTVIKAIKTGLESSDVMTRQKYLELWWRITSGITGQKFDITVGTNNLIDDQKTREAADYAMKAAPGLLLMGDNNGEEEEGKPETVKETG